jgi:hypothetical protein
VEVVNFWVGAESLAGLVTLSNFDQSTNDNVIIPFASGCQSMWTLPYRQQLGEHGLATVGALDPAMRCYLPGKVLLFSMPAGRFVELAGKVDRSFAVKDDWLELVGKQKGSD